MATIDIDVKVSNLVLDKNITLIFSYFQWQNIASSDRKLLISYLDRIVQRGVDTARAWEVGAWQDWYSNRSSSTSKPFKAVFFTVQGVSSPHSDPPHWKVKVVSGPVTRELIIITWTEQPGTPVEIVREIRNIFEAGPNTE